MPDIMAIVFNNCLDSGSFPQLWKESIMVPIPKKQNPKYLNNLRPISLIPLPGKLLERIIHKHLYLYLESNLLLNDRQGGFRKEMNTSYTIMELVNYVNTGFNTNVPESCISAFADLSKAFDSIDRDIFIKRSHYMVLHTIF